MAKVSNAPKVGAGADSSVGESTSKPILVKVLNVHVKIYRRLRRKGKAEYPVFDVADYSSGRRKFLSFADEQQARDKATDIATKLANRNGAVRALSSSDCATYVRALELLKPTGVPLELAAATFAEAHQKLGGRSLMEAVNFYVRRHPVTLPRKTVSEAFKEMRAAKKADGLGAIYLKDLEFRVGRFAGDFQRQFQDLSEAEINEWLRGIGGSARNRNNFRNAVRVLYRFAEMSG